MFQDNLFMVSTLLESCGLNGFGFSYKQNYLLSAGLKIELLCGFSALLAFISQQQPITGTAPAAANGIIPAPSWLSSTITARNPPKALAKLNAEIFAVAAVLVPFATVVSSLEVAWQDIRK